MAESLYRSIFLDDDILHWPIWDLSFYGDIVQVVAVNKVGLSPPSPPSYHMMTLREIPKGSLHSEKYPKVRYTQRNTQRFAKFREIPKGPLHSEKYPKVHWTQRNTQRFAKLREIPKGSLHSEKYPKNRYTHRITKGSLHSEKYPKVRYT